MIKAREYANMRIKVVSRNNDETVEPENTRKAIPAAIYALFNKPNVLQSRWEFMQQRKIFLEVGGNSMTYGNFGFSKKPSINSILALWNVWPAYMEFQTTGGYFDAVKLEEVIKEWRFKAGQYSKVWQPWEIMHKNTPNTDPHEGLILGRSVACNLVKPLSNIEMAYEARNVLMKNRGMRIVISSAKSDATANLPFLPEEKEDMQEAIKDYGILENQHQMFFSPLPINVTAIDQDVRKLGLFDEIATDAIMVANAYGVPEVLLKLYLKGATFENQEASVRRLYQGTLIPEAEDDMIAFNSFLGLDETDWKIVASFDHVAALQESEEVKAKADQTKKTTAINEFKAGLITREEYRKTMNYGSWPTDGTVNVSQTVITDITNEAAVSQANGSTQQQGQPATN